MVVGFVAVFVVDLWVLVWIGNKMKSNQPMYSQLLSIQCHNLVPVEVGSRRQHNIMKS